MIESTLLPELPNKNIVPVVHYGRRTIVQAVIRLVIAELYEGTMAIESPLAQLARIDVSHLAWPHHRFESFEEGVRHFVHFVRAKFVARGPHVWRRTGQRRACAARVVLSRRPVEDLDW